MDTSDPGNAIDLPVTVGTSEITEPNRRALTGGPSYAGLCFLFILRSARSAS